VWLLPVEPTFRQRLARFPKNSWYPWKLFGGRYDQENWGLAPRATLHFLSVADLNDLKKRAAAGDAGAEERMGVACLCGETGASATNGEQALAWFLKAADQGDVLAQMDLEWMYRVGMGVPMDQKKSFDWGLKAAEHGDPVAEFFLAGHYEEGEGVAKNLAEALRWCEKSADQGYGEAEDRFGDALYRGEGVAKDQKRAVGYFLKAAPGNAHASHVVAICYADGFCFKKDLVEAYKWCLVSLSMDTDTQEASGLAEKLRKQLTEAQIKQAEKESIDNRPLDTPAKQ
jgi:TPR repeat protein